MPMGCMREALTRFCVSCSAVAIVVGIVVVIVIIAVIVVINVIIVVIVAFVIGWWKRLVHTAFERGPGAALGGAAGGYVRVAGQKEARPSRVAVHLRTGTPKFTAHLTFIIPWLFIGKMVPPSLPHPLKYCRFIASYDWISFDLRRIDVSADEKSSARTCSHNKRGLHFTHTP